MSIRVAALVFLVVVAVATPYPAGASHHGSHVVVPPGQAAPRVGPSYLYPDPETIPGVLVIRPEISSFWSCRHGSYGLV